MVINLLLSAVRTLATFGNIAKRKQMAVGWSRSAMKVSTRGHLSGYHLNMSRRKQTKGTKLSFLSLRKKHFQCLIDLINHRYSKHRKNVEKTIRKSKDSNNFKLTLLFYFSQSNKNIEIKLKLFQRIHAFRKSHQDSLILGLMIQDALNDSRYTKDIYQLRIVRGSACFILTTFTWLTTSSLCGILVTYITHPRNSRSQIFYKTGVLNPLRANPIKWSNTLKELLLLGSSPFLLKSQAC